MSYEDKAPQVLATFQTGTDYDVKVGSDRRSDPAEDGCGAAATAVQNDLTPTGNSQMTLMQMSGPSARAKAFPYLVAALLLGFGTYQSALYYGHQVVPNPDFPGFLRVGHELLSLHVPSSFKRAPVLGLLQASLSHMVGGPHPDLTAGWLLNAILHPLSLVFLWLIGRRIIGRAACWLALLAALNPWSLRNVPDPIAETTLHFFIVATFCAIFARSRWRYVLAAVATMVRYDAAALIVVAFVLDMARNQDVRRRLSSVLGATLACVPLGIWLAGTLLHFGSEGSTHYLNELGTDGNATGVALGYITEIWRLAVTPLFKAPPSLPSLIGIVSAQMVCIVLLAGFCVGLVRGFVKRQWEVIGLLLFLTLYLVVHTLHSFMLARFCSTVSWIVLLVACFGLRELWADMRLRVMPSNRMTTALSALGCVVLSLWAFDVARTLPELIDYSMRSASVPAVAIVVAGSFVACERGCLTGTRSMRQLLVLVMFCGIIVSNQSMLALVLRNGQGDIEFKQLADWYRDHTHAGEKLTSTYAGVLELYLPDRRADFIHMASLKADTLEGFTENCRQAGIAYVVWDSRLGASGQNRYHKFYGLDALTELGKPVSTGPYAFVTQIKTDLGRYINVFYLGARLDDDGQDVRLVESSVGGFQAEPGRPLLP